VIQIIFEGTFVDPEVGEYFGGGGGSGFIIDPSGIAVTNNHVVTGAATLTVYIGGDTTKSYNAKILGVSECSDLAVIDIEGDGFPYLEWYSEPINVGLEIYTAGFPLVEPEYTLTKGIVSKESTGGETSWASIGEVIMHDATINPGNSGGPLITGDGKVVGVNYRGRAEQDQYFAIGRDVAVPIIETLKSGQDVDSIGVNGEAVVWGENSEFSGVWVSSVASGSPSDKTGITGGDIITMLEGTLVATDGTLTDYCKVIRTHGATETMGVEVIRFASSEVLEGQLNGTALVTTYSGADSSSSDTGGDTSAGTGGDAPAYFFEDFNAEFLENWSWFITNGDENQFYLYSENSKLVFDLEGPQLYTYLVYDPWIYESIVMETMVENRGKNTNNVGLLCHATDYGWYEFSISGGGEWFIWAYDATANQYDLLKNGGSTAIRMGKDSNTYGVICDGNTLSLYINGTFIDSITDREYNFREGQIGIGVSSFDILPIILEFDWIDVYQP
jgi:S1-C subfamily serine protease